MRHEWPYVCHPEGHQGVLPDILNGYRIVHPIPQVVNGRNFAPRGVPRKIQWLKCPRRLWDFAQAGRGGRELPGPI